MGPCKINHHDVPTRPRSNGQLVLPKHRPNQATAQGNARGVDANDERECCKWAPALFKRHAPVARVTVSEIVTIVLTSCN